MIRTEKQIRAKIEEIEANIAEQNERLTKEASDHVNEDLKSWNRPSAEQLARTASNVYAANSTSNGNLRILKWIVDYKGTGIEDDLPQEQAKFVVDFCSNGATIEEVDGSYVVTHHNLDRITAPSMGALIVELRQIAFANAKTTYQGAGGHGKAHHNEQAMNRFAAKLKELGVEPDGREGSFNGYGSQ